MRRRILRVDGRDNFEEVGDSWQAWNQAIGADIGEIVPGVNGKVELWCDEEALCKAEPVLNLTACLLTGTRIYGDVIIFRAGDIK